MTLSTALFIFAAQLLAYLVKGLIGFGNPLISAPILSMGLAAWLGPRLEEEKLQKGAIVLFLLGGVSIIVKSVVFHT